MNELAKKYDIVFVMLDGAIVLIVQFLNVNECFGDMLKMLGSWLCGLISPSFLYLHDVLNRCPEIFELSKITIEIGK